MFLLVSKEVHTRAYKKANERSKLIQSNIERRFKRYCDTDDICFDPVAHNKYVDKTAKTLGCGCQHCQIKKRLRDLRLYLHKNKSYFEEERVMQIKKITKELRIKLKDLEKHNNIRKHICIDI